MKMEKLLILMLLATSAMAQIPTDSLVGYYPFTGNANDYSSKSNNGSVNGATLTTDRFGNANSAYSFNGTYINVPNTKSIDSFPNGQSISFWIKISQIPTPPQIEPIIEKYDQHLTIESNGNAGQGYTVQFDASGNIYYSFKSGLGTTWGNCVIPSTSYPINQYFNVIFTNDNDSLRGYINCVKISSSKIPSGTVIGLNDSSLLIGNTRQTYAGNKVSPFVGSLSNIRIYNNGLTSSEICYLNYESPCLNPITVYDTTHVTVHDTLHICVTDTLKINVTLTGIVSPNNTNTIKVYPNPTKDHITVDFGSYTLMNGYTLKISNMLGQVVFTTLVTQQQTYIDLSTFTGKGTYFVNIIDNAGNTIDTKKIILN